MDNDILCNHKKITTKRNIHNNNTKYKESIIKYICENRNTNLKNTNKSDSSSIEPEYKESSFVNKLIIWNINIKFFIKYILLYL